MIKDGVLYSVNDYCHFAGVTKTSLALMLDISPQSLTRYINNDWYSVRRIGNKLDLISTKTVRSAIIKEGS